MRRQNLTRAASNYGGLGVERGQLPGKRLSSRATTSTWLASRNGNVRRASRARVHVAGDDVGGPSAFGPLCAAIDSAVNLAIHRLWLAAPWVYTRTNNSWLLGLIQRVAAARAKDVDVRVYLRRDQNNSYAVTICREAGVKVVQSTSPTGYLHLKVIVSDNAALVMMLDTPRGELDVTITTAPRAGPACRSPRRRPPPLQLTVHLAEQSRSRAGSGPSLSGWH